MLSQISVQSELETSYIKAHLDLLELKKERKIINTCTTLQEKKANLSVTIFL